MIESFIITFRETLEAALVIGIIFGYLKKTNQTHYFKVIYLGLFVGFITSILGAFLFNIISNGFTGRTEQIFEGITMILGAIFLTTMIIWMKNQKNIAQNLEQKVAGKLAYASKFGLFSLIFISILREGIETIIFLSVTSFTSPENNLWGAMLGIITALILGFLFFKGSLRINLKILFNITSYLLIFFSAGLIAHGVHELEEAQIIPIIIEHVWDLNPPLNLDGSYPLLHENGYIGSILKGLFGFNGNPSLLEVIFYSSYLVIAILFMMKKSKTKNKKAEISELQ